MNGILLEAPADQLKTCVELIIGAASTSRDGGKCRDEEYVRGPQCLRYTANQTTSIAPQLHAFVHHCHLQTKEKLIASAIQFHAELLAGWREVVLHAQLYH